MVTKRVCINDEERAGDRIEATFETTISTTDKDNNGSTRGSLELPQERDARVSCIRQRE